ncbi:MAG: hypothetical protein ACI38Q_06940 [Candidatus Bruticola sp.]
MGDSILSSMGFNRSNLNQDVARVVAEQGKLNYAQVLETCYPARPITPVRYKSAHLKARRVKCMFVGPNDRIPVRCPRGYDLLAVMGIGFTRRETEDIIEALEKVKTGSNVIVGIPEQPLPGSAQLKELQALNMLSAQEPYTEAGNAQNLLQSRRQMVRRQLLEKLRPQLTPNNFRWLYKGEVYDGIKSGMRDIFFTDVLETIYRKCPPLKPCGSLRDRCEAADILFNTKEPLQFTFLDKGGGYKVIKEFLVKGGVVSVAEDCGSYSVHSVNGIIDKKEPLAAIWNRLLVMLIGSGQEECSSNLRDILRKFSARPYGISTSFLNVLLAAAVRRFSPSLHIVKRGQDIRLDSTSLKEAWGDAANCCVVYTPQAPYSSIDGLQSIVDIFGFVGNSTQVRSMWEIAQDSLTSWYSNLSPLALTLALEPGMPAYRLNELLANKKNESARQFICEGLLAAAGLSCLPEGADLEKFCNWLREARGAFDSCEEKFRSQLAKRIAVQFGGQADELPEKAGEYVPVLNALFRRWFSRLYPNSGGQKVSAWAAALIEMYSLEPEADAHYWFELLPLQFDLPRLSRWDRDHSVTFVARLVRACLELELWHIERLFPMPQDKEEAERKLSHWMRSVMNGTGLSKEQRESIILDLLEELCWSK